MKKNKKIKVGRKPTLFGGATKSLRKLSKGAASGIGGLSTTQKVVGGAALVALGWRYVAKRRKVGAPVDTTTDATGAEENLAALNGSM